jgi:hypothetical protein
MHTGQGRHGGRPTVTPGVQFCSSRVRPTETLVIYRCLRRATSLRLTAPAEKIGNPENIHGRATLHAACRRNGRGLLGVTDGAEEPRTTCPAAIHRESPGVSDRHRFRNLHTVAKIKRCRPMRA